MRRKLIAAVITAVLLFSAAVSAPSQTGHRGPWQMQQSGTTASLRGIFAAGGGVAWASGTGGTVLRTEDSGYMWQSCAMPPGAETLDFRGLWASGANTAVVMSSGPGDQSRVYKTSDGCSHWRPVFTNPDKDGFWDALVFTDPQHGYLLGDPIRTPGAARQDFQLFATRDGGETWVRLAQSSFGMGEDAGAFAASNTALAVLRNHLWFGTGGRAGAFVVLGSVQDSGALRISRRVPVPLAGGADAAGVFSVAARDATHLVAVGGEYSRPAESSGTAAWSEDGGHHWTAATRPPQGYRSAVAWFEPAKAWLAAGTTGSSISYDDGRTWRSLDDGNWNAISISRDGKGWIAGPHGRLAQWNAASLPH